MARPPRDNSEDNDVAEAEGAPIRWGVVAPAPVGFGDDVEAAFEGGLLEEHELPRPAIERIDAYVIIEDRFRIVTKQIDTLLYQEGALDALEASFQEENIAILTKTRAYKDKLNTSLEYKCLSKSEKSDYYNYAFSEYRTLRYFTYEIIELFRSLITEKQTDYKGLSIKARRALLDFFTKTYPGAPISEFHAELFPELEAASKSTSEVVSSDASPRNGLGQNQAQHSVEAPAALLAPSWADREAGETPVSFVKKHYGVWRDGVWNPNGLTKPDLRRDLNLYQALASYERRHPDEALNLPTKKQANDTWVERVLSGEEMPTSLLEKERFAAAARRRGKTVSEGKS